MARRTRAAMSDRLRMSPCSTTPTPPRAITWSICPLTSASRFFHSGLTNRNGTKPQSPAPTCSTGRTTHVTVPVAWSWNALSTGNDTPSSTRCSNGSCPGR
jgi:hypothetical protein